MLQRVLILLALVCLPAKAAAQGMIGFDGCQFEADVPSKMTNIDDPARKGASHVVLSGNVVFTCKEMKIFADEVEGDTDRDLVQLRGNVVIQRPGLRLFAEHAVLDRHSHNGTLFNVQGSSQTSATAPKKDQYGGMEPDFTFWAAEVEKTGPETFELKNGSATSCVQATPRWSLSGTSGTLVHDKRVTFVNAVLRVKDVPVFYIPYIYYPINKEDRSTGFLMPGFGSSRIGGFQLSNAFFWAIDRSEDATFYHEYMKKAGNGLGAEYRFITAPGSRGDVRFHFLDQNANEQLGTPNEQSYTLNSHINQAMAHGLLLVGTIDYYSSATAQQLYQQNVFSDVSSRTRSIDLALSGGRRRYHFSLNYSQHDIFQTFTTASRLGYAPQLTLTAADAPLGHSRVYFGANAEAAYLLKTVDLADPSTNHNLWRFDARPHIQAPLSKLSFLTVTTSAGFQITEWLESIDTTSGTQQPVPLTRQLFSSDVSVIGPVFSRIWQRPTSKVADRVKHVIEPSASVRWISPFNDLAKVPQIDGTDSIVGGTATYTYGLANRVLIRKPGTESAPGPVREILNVNIVQSYYTNSLASAVDSFYTPCAAGAFSPVQVTVQAHPTTKLTGQMTTDINTAFHTPCTFGASGSLNLTASQFALGWSKRYYIPGLVNFDNPDLADNFLNGSATWRRANGHLGGTYSIQYDVRRNIVVQQRIGVFYNSQCCGVSFDYQAREVTPGLINLTRNRQFNFAFTLAGLGSFSNPLGSFGK